MWTGNIVIAGRDRETLEWLASVTREFFGCEPQLQHINNGHADPLYGHTEIPDLLILDLAADWDEQLGAIQQRPAAARPVMLVIGPTNEPEAMRLAMRAGARDYLLTPVDENDLRGALGQLNQEERAKAFERCHWTSVIGVKGGVGASTIACNLAQFVSESGCSNALLDLNLQAGSLAGYLDLEPRNSFRDATYAADDLDSVALAGYMSTNRAGLNLLAAPTDELLLPEQISGDNVATLFDLIVSNFEYVVADLPRQLDHVVAASIEHSSDCLLVMEQSVAALRETLRMLEILGNEFGITDDQIRIIVNRYSKNASVSERQIRKNLGELEIICIPNDFRPVSESLDLGNPVISHAPGSTAAKALVRLGEQITGRERQRNSLVSSLTSMLRS